MKVKLLQAYLQVPRRTGGPELTVYVASTDPVQRPRDCLLSRAGRNQWENDVGRLAARPDESPLAPDGHLPRPCVSQTPVAVARLQPANELCLCQIRQDAHDRTLSLGIGLLASALTEGVRDMPSDGVIS